MARALHHLDLWVAELSGALDEWGWLLCENGLEVEIARKRAPGSNWATSD